MGQVGWRRRDLLAGGSALIALAVAARGSAQSPAQTLGNELSRVLGVPVPPQVTALVPGEAFEAAGFIRALLALESEAKALRLPRSKLSLHDSEVPSDLERLYEQVLPRLVALVDRAELRNLGFADRAGALLAKLHGTQHVPAEGYLSLNDATIPPDLGTLELPGAREPVPEPAPEPTAEPSPDVPDSISRSLKFVDLEAEYAVFFATMELREQHRESAEWHRTMMLQSRSRYEAVARRTGVPWHFIAAVHGLEASFNFRAHFHNGDFPLTQRTRQVPAGRPRTWLPPSSWEDSAVDALRLMGYVGESDWSLSRMLYRIEGFNGFGYRRMARPTPYLWSYSNHYERGKYVADGKFDPRARSQQCGAAVMFKLLAEGGTVSFK
jgi:lysozyme family protein